MAQYINKSALVAGIKAHIEGTEISQKAGWIKKRDANKRITLLKSVLSLIDTLEVKEVDLEKEINDSIPSKYCWSGDGKAVYTKEQMVEFAKHFFELGLKAQQ